MLHVCILYVSAHQEAKFGHLVKVMAVGYFTVISPWQLEIQYME